MVLETRAHLRKKWVLGLFLFITAALPGMAQLPTATVLGVVKDSSGAVIPATNLTARNADTGQTRQTVSDQDGSYRFAALPVGHYEVSAEHAGFRTELRGGLTLDVSDEAVVNFALEIGTVGQSVTVTAEAPLVNTTSGSLGGLVDEQKMADLPLNGRNYDRLVLLQPGIAQFTSNLSSISLAGTLYSSNGASIYSNYYLLDGASVTGFFGTSSASISNESLGVDGIREYRVVTNSFSAEYGMRMGSEMVMVSKGGTNKFHGDAYDYLRNSALDARNFFDAPPAQIGHRLPEFRRNQFGGAFGGPIKKDKTFFFGVYEGLRAKTGITTQDILMPAACHTANNIVNSSCISSLGSGTLTVAPVVRPILALYPSPNLPNNGYTFPFSQPQSDNYGQMRTDHTFSTKDTLFGRYTIWDSTFTLPPTFPQFPVFESGRGQFLTLSEDHIFSSSLLNTARLSYSRTRLQLATPQAFVGPQYSFIPGDQLGSITIGGVSSFGPPANAPTDTKQDVYTFSDDLFYTRGRHSLKFGTLINHFLQHLSSPSVPFGQAAFASVSSFLSGNTLSETAGTAGSIIGRTYQFNTLGFYVQDDIRLKSNLTLNLGVRYEPSTQYHETNGHGANIINPLTDTTATVGLPFANPAWHNIGPRLGFAWDVMGDGKTAVRGGFGLLYDVADFGNALYVSASAQPPFSSQSNVNNTPLTVPFVFPPSTVPGIIREVTYHMEQPKMLEYNLTVERQLPWSMALSLSYVGSQASNLSQFTDGNPTVPTVLASGQQFWPVGVQRANPIWGPIVLDDFGGWVDYNSLQVSVQKRLTRGLQFQASYTWSKALDVPIAQTGAENSASSPFRSDANIKSVDKGHAEFDIPQNLRFNMIYNLPKFSFSNQVESKVLNGWWMSGILSVQDGLPFSPNLSSNRSRSGVNHGSGGIDRPNVIAGRNDGNITQGHTAGCLGVPAGQQLGTTALYFDPCAYTIPDAGFLGDAGRNSLRGPGFGNLDFSLVKDTSMHSLGEGGEVEFRAEVFNILNRPNFAEPGEAVFAANGPLTNDVEAPLASTGRITSTITPSRQIQFALKLIF